MRRSSVVGTASALTERAFVLLQGLMAARAGLVGMAAPAGPTVGAGVATCPVCGRDFRGPYHTTLLRRHMRTHTGEKPYACPHCPYRTAHNSALNVHVRNHTGEKPFACPLCPFRTWKNGVFKNHMNLHAEHSQLH